MPRFFPRRGSRPAPAGTAPASSAPTAPAGTTLLEVVGISKRFGGNLALDDVSVAIAAGAIHALLGENGAGKTTLTRIVAGVETPDSGDVLLGGEPVAIGSPARALALGIGLIHQELSLIPTLSVGANVFLGREPRTARGTIDDREIRRRTTELLAYVGARSRSSDLVDNLSLAEQQLVEIARVLSRRPRLLIMDEPTASLAADTVKRLFEIVRELRDDGVAVVYISHELEEVLAIADRVTVLKDGRVTMTKPVAETSQQEIVRSMVGRDLDELFPARGEAAARPEPPVLEVRGLSLPGHFEDVSLRLHAGEVVGLAGLVGAGRSALALSLFGMPPAPLLPRDVIGSILLHGREISVRSPRHAIRLGIGLVPEDRKTEGLLVRLAVSENIALPQLGELARHGLVSGARRSRVASEQVAQLRIVTASTEAPVASLSGGNQQKVVLAKWLAKRCSILLLDEPTRGVDIGAKTEIYHLIRELVAHDVAVLLISSSLPEILGLSDRVLVMSKGRIVAEHETASATEEGLLSAALGLAAEERALDGA